MNYTITVIGNRGYLGRHLQDYFHSKDNFMVTGFDHEEKANFEAQVKESEIVIFANGLSDHELGREDPFLDYQRNVDDYIQYLNSPALRGKKVIMLGSTCQYGKLSGEITEATTQDPTEPQGESKRYIERLLPYYSNKYDFSYCHLRLAAVVGSKSSLSNLSLFEKIILDEINNKIFDVWGGRFRSYSYILIEDFLRVLEHICIKKLYENDSYNLSLDSFSFSNLPVGNIQIIEKSITDGYSINSSKLLKKLELTTEKHKITKVVSRLKHELAKLQNN